MSEYLPARRHQHVEADGTIVSYSIPEGVTDEAAAAEVAAMRKAIERDYTQDLKFREPGLSTDVRWLARQPRWRIKLHLWMVLASRVVLRGADDIAFWLKCRWLDLYWFFKDKTARPSPPAQRGSV